MRCVYTLALGGPLCPPRLLGSLNGSYVLGETGARRLVPPPLRTPRGSEYEARLNRCVRRESWNSLRSSLGGCFVSVNGIHTHFPRVLLNATLTEVLGARWWVLRTSLAKTTFNLNCVNGHDCFMTGQ